MRNQTIAIIGAGFSGVMVAVHLLKNAYHPLTVYLIERRRLMGEGVAYSSISDSHLLNVPAEKMSAFADEPDHFLNWLNHHFPEQEISGKAFVPRNFYSQYLRFILQKAEQQASSQVKLERINDEAIALKKNINQVKINLKSGQQLTVDQVVLALGNFPRDQSLFAPSSRYISSAWSQQKLPSSYLNDPILLIGSGLTAVDQIAELIEQGYQGKIYAISRRGLLPQPHQTVEVYPPFLTPETAPKTARGLLHRLRQEIQIAEQNGYNWRSVIDALREQTPVLWQNLPLQEQKRFLRHVQPYWEVCRHRVSTQIYKQIQALLKSKQLVIYAGQILDYFETKNGIDIIFHRRFNPTWLRLRVGLVVNCTGLASNYHQIQQPLIVNLLNQGLIRPHPLEIGLDVTQNGALIDKNGHASQQLYTLGSPCKGLLWETTAVREIRDQAKNLALELFNIHLHKPTVYPIPTLHAV